MSKNYRVNTTLLLLLPLVVAPIFLGIFLSSPAEAGCTRILGRKVCTEDLDPTRNIPGSAVVAEEAWGGSGASAYPAAAEIMRQRNGIGQRLDERQKQLLRPHFGSLVDRVSVAYNARMMSDWCAAGKCVNLGGVESAAQTYCNNIYVAGSYQANNPAQIRLLAHELFHSRQCEQLGGAGKFGYHYFKEYKKAGQNYENNKLEREARDFAGRTRI